MTEGPGDTCVSVQNLQHTYFPVSATQPWLSAEDTLLRQTVAETLTGRMRERPATHTNTQQIGLRWKAKALSCLPTLQVTEGQAADDEGGFLGTPTLKPHPLYHRLGLFLSPFPQDALNSCF